MDEIVSAARSSPISVMDAAPQVAASRAASTEIHQNTIWFKLCSSE